jgi:hypothetical protein
MPMIKKIERVGISELSSDKSKLDLSWMLSIDSGSRSANSGMAGIEAEPFCK